MSNSVDRAVYLAEWEVYGTRIARRRWEPASDRPSGPDEAAPPPQDLVEDWPVLPATVVTSDDGPEHTNGWAAVDGDASTLWEGTPGAGGWHIAVGYESTRFVTNLVLDLAEGSLTDIQRLYSLDADDWLPLPADLALDPVELNYLWLLFQADDRATSAVPKVIEIRPQP